MIKTLTLPESYAARIASGQTFIEFSTGLNLLVGENGSGKSTIFDVLSEQSRGIERGAQVVCDGETDVKAMRMMDMGNRIKTDRNSTGERVRAALCAYEKSSGEANWPYISKAFKEFEDGVTVLLDEPEIAIDVKKMESLRRILVREAKRLQFIIATHNPILWLTPKVNVICLSKNQNFIQDSVAIYKKYLK